MIISRKLSANNIQSIPLPGGPVHLVVDSTGLKFFGEGEWKVRQHGWSKRRLWLKLHLAVNEATGEIMTHKLTPGNVHDGPVLPELLDQVEGPLTHVSADKAYDSFANHKAILARDARPVIPPRHPAQSAP